MTNEEALMLLNDYMEFAIKYQRKQEYAEMLIFCKSALEKRIPKSTQKVEVQGYMRKHWNPKCCPTCRTQHYGKPKYCDECGQALDWSDEDER